MATPAEVEILNQLANSFLEAAEAGGVETQAEAALARVDEALAYTGLAASIDAEKVVNRAGSLFSKLDKTAGAALTAFGAAAMNGVEAESVDQYLAQKGVESSPDSSSLLDFHNTMDGLGWLTSGK